MCHPDIPTGMVAPEAPSAEVLLRLPSDEAMPALHVGLARDPGVLLVGDVFGRSPFYENLAAIIAAKGFQVLVPDFFFRQGTLTEQTKAAAFGRRASLDERRTLDDLGSAIDWLRESSAQEQVGTMGFCMGGTFVLDLASTQADLATVAFYGFPVPQATIPKPPPAPLDLVDDLRGPVLAIWGEDDETVGIDNVRRYAARASEVDDRFHHEILTGYGHGFLGETDLDADDPAARSWHFALAHLQAHLRTEERD